MAFDVKTHLKQILPKIFESRNKKLLNIEFENSPKIGTDHFTSHNHFAKITIQEPNEEKTSHNVVIKSQSLNPEFRNAAGSNDQFYNEATMYETVLPTFESFLKKRRENLNLINELCPKNMLSHFDDNIPENGVIILENLKQKGFEPATSLVELDYDHCVIIMKKIAQFHAISYAFKLLDKENFEKLAFSFRETKFPFEPPEVVARRHFLYQKSSQLYTDYLKDNPDHDITEEFLNKIVVELDKGFYKCQELVQPKEPFAVLCHGDFCRNNILFKYENQKPIDLKLIDFQTYRYASPAIDLSFFNYMNTTPELRNNNFDNLMTIYYKNLITSISDIVNKTEEDVKKLLNWEMFMRDYSEHCLVGFFICSFFLPMMMFDRPQGEPSDFENDFIRLVTKEINVSAMLTDASRDRVIGILKDFCKYKFCV